MIWTTILMAFREIRRNPMRSSLTMLGIVIGVASVIIMVALGRGAAAKITSDISGMGTNLLIATPGSERRGPTASAAQPFKLEDARAVVREMADVADAAPAGSMGALMVNGNLNWMAGSCFYLGVGMAMYRGSAENYSQWFTTLGYRLDNRRKHRD